MTASKAHAEDIGLGRVNSLNFVDPAIACAIALWIRENLDVPFSWNPRWPRGSARGTVVYCHRWEDSAKIRVGLRTRCPDSILLGRGEPNWSRFRAIERDWHYERFYERLSGHELR